VSLRIDILIREVMCLQKIFKYSVYMYCRERSVAVNPPAVNYMYLLTGGLKQLYYSITHKRAVHSMYLMYCFAVSVCVKELTAIYIYIQSEFCFAVSCLPDQISVYLYLLCTGSVIYETVYNCWGFTFQCENSDLVPR